MNTSKKCSRCTLVKDLQSFHNESANADGKGRWCKDCGNEWRRLKPAATKTVINRRYKSMTKYGASIEEIQKRLTEQDFTCAICSKPISYTAEAKRDVPHIDHCHQTGSIRGLLCLTCNTGLGMFQDSSELLEKAITYLLNAVQAERLSELAPLSLTRDEDDAIVRSHGNNNHERLTEMVSPTITE